MMEIQENEYHHHKHAQESTLKENNFLLVLLQTQAQVMQAIKA